MQVTRRGLAIASILALGDSNLLQRTDAHAEAADESAIGQAVEALRKALLDNDKARLEELTAALLSYGHSDDRVQTKAEFIDGVMSRKALMKSLTFPDLNVGLAGSAAVARHIHASESETDGNGKLLARQGYKLA